jgi:UDP-N-acetylmuramate--alanine ligase
MPRMTGQEPEPFLAISSAEFPQLPLPWQRLHLVGVCGAGMKALAELLLDCGCQVTGSDLQLPTPAVASLIRRGLLFHRGHAADFVPQCAQALVYSPAIPAENAERHAAARRHIPQLSYTQFLGRLMQHGAGVCIAGTHGKSTTAAMTGLMLTDAGRSPSVVLGAELSDGGRSGWAGAGELLVVESCEFQRSFLDYSPRYAAILNVEADHFDCFPDLAAVTEAFGEFAERVAPRDGVLVVRSDCEAAVKASERTQARQVTIGPEGCADWWAGDLRRTATGIRFRTYRENTFFAEISLQIGGRHNIWNALAAAALGDAIGLSPREIREGLEEFRGIRRRLELVGSWRGVTLLDDYAHHPTAIRSTLETVREQFGRRRVWCVFQPHQVSRTVALMMDFADAFSAADEILVVPAFAARERVTTEPFQVSRELADQLVRNGCSARFVESLDQITATLDDALEPGDVLITVGAGDIDQVHHEFTRRVQRHPASRRAVGSLYVDEAGRSRSVLPHSA